MEVVPVFFMFLLLMPRIYTTAKENLFIHEAIPGPSLSNHDTKRKHIVAKVQEDGGNSAYAEGWGSIAKVSAN
jgi:uncharacterized protein (DUF885 family)